MGNTMCSFNQGEKMINIKANIDEFPDITVTVMDDILDICLTKTYHIEDKIENKDDYYDYIEDTLNVVIRDAIDMRRNYE